MTDTIAELVELGQLREAIDAAISAVESDPTDSETRARLVDLYCVAGQWEEADRNLELLVGDATSAESGAPVIRQLIRAELARRACFADGGQPEFLGPPSPHLEYRLQAVTELRAGETAAGMKALDAASDAAPELPLLVNGQEVTGLRDLDDVTADLLEAHTSTGRYLWIGWDQIVSLEVHPPEQLHELVWRRATLVATPAVDEAPQGATVYLPSIYIQTYLQESDDQRLLGRGTDWTEDSGPTRGVGQKMLLVGDVGMPMMQLEKIERAPTEE